MGGYTSHVTTRWMIAAIGLVAAACSGPGQSSPDVPTTDSTTDVLTACHPSSTSPGQSYTYVIDDLSIDPTDDPQLAHNGFNLDGLFSAADSPQACGHADLLARDDPDQNCAHLADGACVTLGCALGTIGCVGGVDNQLPTLEAEHSEHWSVASMISDAVRTNRLAIVVRVTGVSCLEDDPIVRVVLYRAFPTFRTSCDSVLPGREYSISADSLVPGATNFETGARYAFDGRILNARVRTQARPSAVAPIPNFFPGSFLGNPFPVFDGHDAQIAFDVSSTQLTRGDLGAWVAGDDMVAFLLSVAPDQAAFIRTVVGSLVDHEVNGVCSDLTAAPPRFGGISVGFGVHAVPATISTTVPIATGPADGVCGTLAHDQ